MVDLTLRIKNEIFNPKPETRNPEPETRNILWLWPDLFTTSIAEKRKGLIINTRRQVREAVAVPGRPGSEESPGSFGQAAG